jgi:uncharacterized HAD superfamily protein
MNTHQKATLRALFQNFTDIAVDFDDVCIVTTPHLHEWHNERYGSTHTLADYNRYDLSNLWEVELHEMLHRAETFHTQRDTQVIPVPGALEALREIAKHKRIHVVTFRSQEIKNLTEKTISHLFPGIFSSVEVCGYGAKGKITFTSKQDICLKKSYPLLIEDSLDASLICAKAGIWSLLLDTEWNTTDVAELPEKLVRVHSWAEIQSLLLS